jgi:tripeptide aminopeptidase
MLGVPPARPVRDRLVATFERLARVDSPSGSEGALARVLVAELSELGLDVTDDGSGADCGNVIARLVGDSTLEPLMFTSHMDVVAPCHGVQPRLEDGVFVSAGDTVLGADAKASLAALLEVARVLVSDTGAARPRPPLELVFTWGEENGHLGARALDLTRLRSRRAYVLDGLTPVGTIIVAAPTYHAFSIRVMGRAAHAGVEPERGISAIVVAARAVSRLAWGRLDESTTANVGTIRGGSVRNAVAAEAVLEGEVRSLEADRAAKVVQVIQDVFSSTATEAGASVQIDASRRYAGYTLDAHTPVVQLASSAFSHLEGGGPSQLLETGGGSDANELNARDVVACVLGIGAEECHSMHERLSVSQLELLTDWVLGIIEESAA